MVNTSMNNTTKLPMQMTQTTLSNLFNRNYKEIYDYTSKASIRFGMANSINSLIAECYLYLDSKRKDLETESQMISWAKTFIKNNLRWTESPFRKMEKGRGHSEFEDWGQSQYDTISEEDIMELWDTFNKNLNSYDKRLFNIYTVKGLRKGIEVSSYLNVSISSAFNVINECKQVEERFRNFIKQNVI